MNSTRPTVFIALLAFGSVPIAYAQRNQKTETCIKAVLPSLEKSGGQFTSDVRSAYVAWAESRVLRGITDAGLKVPSAWLDEVRAGPMLQDAIFGSIFPPDPSVLQNYARLQRELKPSVSKDYRSMVVAVAIAHRTKGVEASAMFLSDDLWQDNVPADWGDHTLESSRPWEEDGLIHTIADYMRANRVTAVDLYLQSQLIAYLRAAGIAQRFIDETHTSPLFGERLKYAFGRTGPAPTSATADACDRSLDQPPRPDTRHDAFGDDLVRKHRGHRILNR